MFPVINYLYSTVERVNNLDRFHRGEQSLHKLVLDLDALVSTDADRLRVVDEREDRDRVMWVIDVSQLSLFTTIFLGSQKGL